MWINGVFHPQLMDKAKDGTEGGGAGGGSSDGGGGADNPGANDGDQGGSEGAGGQKPEDQTGGDSGEDDLVKLKQEKEDLLKETMKRKERLRQAEEELNQTKTGLEEAQNRLKAFDGIDPKEVQALLKERADREKAELEKAGEWDKLKARMAEEHQTEVSKVRTEAEATIAELSEKLAKREADIEELTIGREFSDSEFVSDSLTLTPSKARIIYGEHFEVVDGKVVGYDKPAGNESRKPFVDGSGNPLPFNEAIQRIVQADPDRDRLIRSKMKPGSGSGSEGAAPSKDKGFGRERIAEGLRKSGQVVR